MNMQDAMEIIEGRKRGFLVHLEHMRGGMLHSDYFPDVRGGDEPIETEEEAWRMATQFASKTRGKCVNLYAVHSHDFTPVPGYMGRKIENR